MGVFDAMSAGLDKVSAQSSRLVSNLLWRAVAGRAGDVLDSRRGPVHWVPDPQDHAFDIVNPGLPASRVTLRLSSVAARVGDRDVALVAGKRALRRATYSAHTDVDGCRYLLRQRRRRLATFERDGLTLATLSRPRGSTRVVDWGSASIDDAEIALAHALAVYAGIGAPGAVVNLAANLSP